MNRGLQSYSRHPSSLVIVAAKAIIEVVVVAGVEESAVVCLSAIVKAEMKVAH